MNKYRLIPYWTFSNKRQWLFFLIIVIFIERNASEKVVCKVAFILFLLQCGKSSAILSPPGSREIWVNSPGAAYVSMQGTESALVQVMAYRLFDQAITWTNADLLSVRPLGTKFNEIRIKIQNFSSMKMHLKMSSVVLSSFWSSDLS